MGVPQTRHRVFFISARQDTEFNFENLDMHFNYEKITYGDIKSGIASKIKTSSQFYKLLDYYNPKSDKSIGDINLRVHNKLSGFQSYIIDESDLIPTLRSKPDIIDIKEKSWISNETLTSAQTFPKDYDFIRQTRANVAYMLGMSVPPIMIKRIVTRLKQTIRK